MAGQERRYRNRVSTRRLVKCRSLLATGSRAPFPAETLDISTSGVGLLVDTRVRAGTPITVELRFDEPRLDLKLDGVVMHALPMSGRWFAGVRFVGIGLLPELELSRFVVNEDRLLRASRDDRREVGEAAATGRGQPAPATRPARLAAAS